MVLGGERSYQLYRNLKRLGDGAFVDIFLDEVDVLFSLLLADSEAVVSGSTSKDARSFTPSLRGEIPPGW